MIARKIVGMRISVAATLLTGGCALGLWGWTHHRVETHIYSASEFGGYVGANRKRLPDTLIQRASDAYAAGRYAEAEQIANEIIAQPTSDLRPPTPRFRGPSGAGRETRLGGAIAGSSSPSHPLTPSPSQALLARRILAYSAARQGKYAEAKARFGALRQAAYESPDHGRQRVAIGEVAPTLEEEGAFQEAVCTSALGDKKAAEVELDGFMRSYPQSILVHAAVKRIGRMHGGDVPKDAEGIWKQAMVVQKAADEADRKADALCGPECLAELLRRRTSRKDAEGPRDAKAGRGASLAQSSQSAQRDMKGSDRGDEAAARGTGQTYKQPATPTGRMASSQQPITVQSLAAEMHTTGEGSNIVSMVTTAAKHGLKLEGVSMTARGLAKQKLPIVALIAPGHYVIVESITPSPSHPLTPSQVTVWDPDARGAGQPGRRTLSAADWEKAWNGVALR